jgi:hypothetical protein
MKNRKIDEKKLIEDFTYLIKLSHDLKICLWHKVEELKLENQNKINNFQELENMVDPEKTENTEKKGTIKQINFEIRREKRAKWMVKPVDIPQEVINHILAQDAKAGIIKMEKFKLPGGRIIDLSFERQTKDSFTCSIIKKSTEKAKKQIPSTRNKTDDLKSLLKYLLNHDNFFNAINEEFQEKWKPVLDSGFIKNEEVIEG